MTHDPATGDRRLRRPAPVPAPAQTPDAQAVAAPALDLAPSAHARGGPAAAPPPRPVSPRQLLGLQRAAGTRLLRASSGRESGPRQAAPASPPLRRVPVVQRVMAAEQAQRVAGQLHDAMDRLGTDEEAVYGALSGRSRADLDVIVAAYQPMAMKGSLDKDLEDELTSPSLRVPAG